MNQPNKTTLRTSWIVILLFITASLSMTAQNYSISSTGNHNAIVGSGDLYTVNGSGGGTITSIDWSSSNNGSVFVAPNSNGIFGASVTFNSTASGSYVSATIHFSSGGSFSPSDYSVTVSNPPTTGPGDPTVTSVSCGSVTLTRSAVDANGNTGPNSPIKWYWQGKNASGYSTSLGDASTITLNESATGTYTYYIRARNTSTLQWSTTTGSVTATINQFTAEPNAVANKPAICTNTSTFITASGVSNATYRWYDGNDNYLNFEGTTFGTGNLASSKTFKVSATVNGCEGPKKSIPITVTAAPAQYGFSGPSTVCSGSTGTLTLSGSQTGKNYQLVKNGSAIGSVVAGTGNSLSWQHGVGTYEVVATNDNSSCNEVQMGSVVTIGTTTPGVISISAGGGNTNICPGTQVTLAVTNGVGTHTWNTGQTGSVINVTPPAGTSTTYSVTVNDACGVTQTKSISLSVLSDVANVSIDSGATSRCAGSGTTSYTASADNVDSYSWSITQGTGSITSTGQVSWNENFVGTATITVTANNSCGSDSASIDVEVTSQITFYRDQDRDGYSLEETQSCTNPDPVLWVTADAIIDPNGPIDCNDQDATLNPATVWYLNADGDEHAAINGFAYGCTPPNNNYDDYQLAALPLDDCDDTDPQIKAAKKWYLDNDSDGLPVSLVYELGCTAPSNKHIEYLGTAVDCNDNNALIRTIKWHLDADGDGLGEEGPDSVKQCTAPTSGGPWVQNNNDQCPGDSQNQCSNFPCAAENSTISGTNHVYTRTYQVERPSTAGIFTEDGGVIQEITYFDGLGRPIQQIRIDQAPDETGIGNFGDIVTHVDYDDFGRMEKEFLPYATETGLPGRYRFDALAKTNAFYLNNDGKYQNTANPYSQKDFEASPLNRVLKQAAPGADWAMNNDHEIEFDYQVNIADEVRLFTVDLSGGNENPALGDADEFYLAKELYKNVTKDENHEAGDGKLHTTEEFTDKQGRVVLKRTYALLSQPVEVTAHDTYYVYDDFGNLTYVLPPKVDVSDGVSTTEMNELCYQYKYDYRNRLIEKKLPGKGTSNDWESIVYNALNQPIMTQDPNLKAAGQWLFTKYDAFGRVAYTGVVTDGQNRAAIQTAVDGLTGQLWVNQSTSATTIGGVATYYDNAAYPTNISEVLTINYYDNYDFLASETAMNLPSAVFTKPIKNHDNSNKIDTRGLPTGSKVKVLGQTDWITTVSGYDDKGRPVYTKSKNSYLATTDIVESLLDFIGKPVKTKSTHSKGGNTIVTLDNFQYDQVGRLLAQTQCIGDDPTMTSCDNGSGGSGVTPLLTIDSETVNDARVASNAITVTNATLSPGAHLYISGSTIEGDQELIVYNTYDNLGQLENKKVGGQASASVAQSTGLQLVDYLYNVRGWLTDINDITSTDKLFNFKIGYNQGVNALYNGNISKTQWRTDNSDDVIKSYDYTYDALNRIKTAVDNESKYNLDAVNYDKNGNITLLARTGHVVANPILNDTDDSDFGSMDILNYGYHNSEVSNRLFKVSDNGNKTYGFADSATDAQDYWYDANGNMIKDDNKGITGITYNHLDLPTQVTFASGNIKYDYAADGTKLKKTISTTGVETLYAGGYIYEGNTLQFFRHAEGYVSAENGNYKYVYEYKDHLNNTRLSYTDANNDGNITTNEIVKESNYYPFGLSHKGYNNNVSSLGNSVAKKYMFGGKEYQDELNLGWYDVSARNYDPALGRWMNLDPLAEQMRRHSPYNYAFDNPVYFLDYDGMKPSGCCPNPIAGQGEGIARAVESKIKSIGKWFSDRYDDVVEFAQNIDGKPVNMSGDGVRIWGNGDGTNSTRDNGESSGPSVDVGDLPSAPGGSKAPKVRASKMGGNTTKNVKKVMEAFKGGQKDTKKVQGFVDDANTMLNDNEPDTTVTTTFAAGIKDFNPETEGGLTLSSTKDSTKTMKKSEVAGFNERAKQSVIDQDAKAQKTNHEDIDVNNGGY